MKSYYTSSDGYIQLYNEDCIKLMAEMPEHSVDLIVADPPYLLSSGGPTCKSGKRVSVNKGKWDKIIDAESMQNFNIRWIKECHRILKPNGSIWIFGTQHNIFSVGFAIQTLNMRILNKIIWQKKSPPPNLGCRCFTHSHETIIWAAQNKKSKYIFNYKDMKKENNNKQMKDIWIFGAPKSQEKMHGKHPTQKPVDLIERIILASSNEGDLILDPFNGSGTTAVACKKLKRKYIGIEIDKKYLNLTKKRL